MQVHMAHLSGVSSSSPASKYDHEILMDRRYLRSLDSSSNAHEFTLLSVLLTVLFVTVGCVLCFCVQFFRSIVSRPRTDGEDVDNPSIAVREGIIANLTPRQRRAVLETFFSETASKATIDMEKEKRKKSFVNRLTESFSKRDNADGSVGSIKDDSTTSIDMCPIPSTPRTTVDLESESEDIVNESNEDSGNGSDSSNDSLFLRFPDELEDGPRKFDYLEEQHDENSSQGRACAICLDEYVKGDEVVHSKHCCHCFHKECIFQWLDKHDSCPCCRNSMVTKEDIHEAAAAVVGRQTMYSAVQQFSSNHQGAPSSPRNLRAISPRVVRNHWSRPSHPPGASHGPEY